MMRYASLLVLWLVSTATSSPLITAENWTAGLDTTKTGWFMQHPLWLDMKAKFQHKCDSIEAVLSKQIPAKQDSIWLTDTAWTEVSGKKQRWRTRIVKPEAGITPSVTPFRPTLLRSRPIDTATGLQVLSAGSGPWKVLSEFSYHVCIYCDYGPPPAGVSYDTVSNFLPIPSQIGELTNYVLLADTTGRTVGWAPWDSLVYFKSVEKARGALPFYRDGFTELLDGTWMDRYWTSKANESRVFENLPASKNNPIAEFGSSRDVTKLDMRRREFRVLRDGTEGYHNTQEFNANISENLNHLPSRVKDAYISVAYHPKTKDPYLYLDPRKIDTVRLVPIPWYSSLILATVQPLSLADGLGQVRMSAKMNSISSKQSLIIPFNTNVDGRSRQIIQLVIHFPASSLSEGYLEGLSSSLAHKRPLEFVQ